MRLIVVILGLFLSVKLYALPAKGQFVITERCELFQSKRKRTNPGNVQSIIDQQFPIIEAVFSNQRLTWVRVLTDENQSPERWISAKCGDAKDLNVANQPVRVTNVCSVADQYDSQVLALSWQSAFCELRGRNKPECRSQHSDRFDANHFSLHGLWPNKRECGRKYGYCGEVKDKPARFCDYPAIALSEALSEQLGLVMPSAAAGTCLERHEWWKHGVCSNATAESYYRVAIALTDQVNSGSWIAQFIQPNIGRRVSQKAFREAFEGSFGKGAANKLALSCDDGLLSEILIQLPASLSVDTQLDQILPALTSQAAGKGNCPAHFTIDSVGF